MPYITNRKRLDESLTPVLDEMDHGITTGELNYLVTKLVNHYIKRKGKSYAHINDVMGVLDCASREFYRRVVAPYEDLKMGMNGDVYDTKPSLAVRSFTPSKYPKMGVPFDI